MNGLIEETRTGSLRVKVYENRGSLGKAAARDVAQKIRQRLAGEKEVNVIFAAAPSQEEFLAALAVERNVDWSRVNAFHMDEYIDLPGDAPQSFGRFLKERIFDKVPFRSVHYMNGNAPDPEAECDRYERLLKDFPAGIVCMGIGENNHIAFNDPHVADFRDRKRVKIVDLDEACRRQQVNDGCFENIGQVPLNAITLTVPALTAAGSVCCMVPGGSKANAVYNTFHQQMSERYPSTILRSHPDAVLYVDRESAALLSGMAEHRRNR